MITFWGGREAAIANRRFPAHWLPNSRARSAFNVDWADPLAATLVCAGCGRIEWFAAEPETIDPEPASPPRTARAPAARTAAPKRR